MLVLQAPARISRTWDPESPDFTAETSWMRWTIPRVPRTRTCGMIRCGMTQRTGFWEHSKALFLQRGDKTEKPLQRGGMERRKTNPRPDEHRTGGGAHGRTGRGWEEMVGSMSSGPGEGICTRPADPGIRRLPGPVQRPSLVSLSPRRGAGQGDEGAAEAAPTDPRFLTPPACRLKKLSPELEERRQPRSCKHLLPPTKGPSFGDAGRVDVHGEGKLDGVAGRPAETLCEEREPSKTETWSPRKEEGTGRAGDSQAVSSRVTGD